MKTFLIFSMILYSTLIVKSYTWEQISCGGQYSIAIRSDGTLWGWGFNANSELGIQGNTIITEPTQIGNNTEWQFVSSGAFHTMAITETGELFCFGLNNNGQLGDSTNIKKDIPTLIKNHSNWNIVSAGLINSFAIKNDGTLWGWGNNQFHQLGRVDVGSVNYPIQINLENDWIDIKCGATFAIALKKDSSLWSWGMNYVGQCGIASISDSVKFPTKISNDKKWINYSCGYDFVLAVKDDSTLWGWGSNQNNQIGVYDSVYYTSPQLIDDKNKWVFVEAGSAYSLAINKDGELWGWGFNGFSQLGTNQSTQIDTPTLIDSDEKWETVSAATGFPNSGYIFGNHTLALKKEKNIICVTGINNTYQLGDGTTFQKNYFECIVGDLSDVEVINKISYELFCTPNPTYNVLTINFDGNYFNKSEIELYNLLGIKQKVIEFESTLGENSINFDVSDLPSGVYFVVINAESKIKRGMFVKE
jgi:hypothetical protein